MLSVWIYVSLYYFIESISMIYLMLFYVINLCHFVWNVENINCFVLSVLEISNVFKYIYMFFINKINIITILINALFRTFFHHFLSRVFNGDQQHNSWLWDLILRMLTTVSYINSCLSNVLDSQSIIGWSKSIFDGTYKICLLNGQHELKSSNISNNNAKKNLELPVNQMRSSIYELLFYP